MVTVFFNERKAVEVRLRQLEETEKRLLAELQAERELLLERLEKIEKDADPLEVPIRKVRRPQGSVALIRELAVAYLKERKGPVRAVEIQRFIEHETGRRISNMSAFMSALEPDFDRVQKLGRGLYIYEYGMDVKED